MNAHRRLVNAEVEVLYRGHSDDVARAIIAAVLLVMHRRGRTAKYIQELFSDILCVLDQPKIMGHQMTDIEVREFISEQYGIDFGRVHMQVETDAEARRRERKKV